MGATPCTYWVCWVIQAWLGQGDWVREGWSMGEFEFILSLSAYSTHPHFWVSSPTIRLPGPAHTYCEADLSLLLVQLRRQIWETELSPLSEDQDFLWGSAHHTKRLPFFPPGWLSILTRLLKWAILLCRLMQMRFVKVGLSHQTLSDVFKHLWVPFRLKMGLPYISETWGLFIINHFLSSVRISLRNREWELIRSILLNLLLIAADYALH